MTNLDIRFTHALLMTIVILLTLNNTETVGGEIGRILHGPLLILFCGAWAYLGRLKEACLSGSHTHPLQLDEVSDGT